LFVYTRRSDLLDLPGIATYAWAGVTGPGERVTPVIQGFLPTSMWITLDVPGRIPTVFFSLWSSGGERLEKMPSLRTTPMRMSGGNWSTGSAWSDCNFSEGSMDMFIPVDADMSTRSLSLPNTLNAGTLSLTAGCLTLFHPASCSQSALAAQWILGLRKHLKMYTPRPCMAVEY